VQLQLGRLKLPLTVAARGEFGYALTVARLTYRDSFALEYVHYLAWIIDVKVDTYFGYESGATVNEGVLQKLLRFYKDSPGVPEALIQAYRKQYGKIVSLEGQTLAELMAETYPKHLTDNLDFVCIEANKQYYNGDLAGAYHWSSAAWDTAMSQHKTDASVAKLAITHARFASNRNDHRKALEIIETAIAFISWEAEPQLMTSLELSRRAVRTRHARIEGMSAARHYVELLEVMRDKSQRPSYARDQEWGWTWYDTLRSAITCLCDSFSEENARLIRKWLPALQSFAADEPELTLVYNSTMSRIGAVLDEPDNALASIAGLNSRIMQTFADECYHAKSRIIATFRQGPEAQEQAISEADLYVRKCGEQNLIHKQEVFFLLATRLRGLVERKVPLR
jgi:hypothetical protein